MSNLAEFPIIQSSGLLHSSRGATFGSPLQVACRTSLTNKNDNPPLHSRVGVLHIRWKERKQSEQAQILTSCERPRTCVYSWTSSVGFARSSFGVINNNGTKGGGRSGSSSQGVGFGGDMRNGGISLKRLMKEIRCSSSSEEDAASLNHNEDGKSTQEAEEAVARVLLEAGLSYEDARVLVSKAPVYVRELAQFAAKLETDDILVGRDEEGATLSTRGDFDTREKIYQLANHGRGMSPFLESLGVHLPSVSRISSSFSSQRLPDLLSKVRYFEKLLKESESGDKPVEGLIQVMMKNLSVPVWEDDNIQRAISLFEKMKHQGGGMGALDKANSALPLFIEAFPQIFKRSLEHEIKPTIRFLEDLGIKGDNLRKVILCFPPILLQDPDKDLVPRKRTLKKVGVRVQDMGRMVVKYPWLLTKCVIDNVDEVIQFLESIKVPKSKIDRIITRCPHLLGCSCTATLEPMVHHINGYGLKSKRLGRAIAQSPELLLHSPEEFDTVVAFLESVGVEANDISKLLRRSPEILGSSIDSTLQKKVEVLEDLGVRRTKLGRIIWFFPEILSMSVESALIPRIKCLRDWGFAKDEISRMTFKFPPILGYNTEAVLSPKLEFLTRTMKRPVTDVVAYPRYFSHSLERKIKPRARVLENRQIHCDLQTMLAKSDEKFAAEFLGFESILIPPIK